LRAPTPVGELGALSSARASLWLKNDGLTHPVYGGNKVRKLERILGELETKPPRRLITFGAAGSHHVLTTALLGRARGLRVGAILVPQPRTAHVEDTLRAALGQGMEAYAANSYAAVPFALARAWRPGDHVIAPGGSNLEGTLAYADAMLELAQQVKNGDLPEPDLVVVSVGSGGTCAGLLAGLVRAGLGSRILGVLAVKDPFARVRILRLARRALAASAAHVDPRELARRLELDAGAVGPGYGHTTEDATRALELARDRLGLALDLTYTGKAFARALLLVANPPVDVRKILYWHTLSAQPLAPLLEDAPELATLPRALRGLLA
jgi:D-cysteine desulfhydrase